MVSTKKHHRQQHDQQSRIFYELSSQILNLIRHPPLPVQFSNELLSTSSSRHHQRIPLTPAGFASLLLGISLSLMLVGLVTFVIGFLLMPWVIGLVMLFYVIGIVSGFVMIFRAIFYHTFSSKKGVHESAVEVSIRSGLGYWVRIGGLKICNPVGKLNPNLKLI